MPMRKFMTGPLATYKPLKSNDDFEKRDHAVKNGYWNDPRWKRVIVLQSQCKLVEANEVLTTMHKSWGL